jgi:hypothetical protein
MTGNNEVFVVCGAQAMKTTRFGVMAAKARRNGSVNLKVCTPQKVQWKPPLSQAATPLCDSGGQQCETWTKEKITKN